MAQRNGAAVDVEPIGIDRQLFEAREHLRRKCFVQLEKIDIGNFQLRFVEYLLNGANRRSEQIARLAGVGLRSPNRIGRYGVDLDALNAVAVPALALEERAIYLIDVFAIASRQADGTFRASG